MLQSLELFGFKSFADRTRFDFHPGITGVVGPNGSGKSNVVDALKWILGVQSAKSLRGKSMSDVIFNGAAGRKPSRMAEATLTFDNSSGFLRIDAPEVQIGRRIMQGGDAEYLINRSPVRLKDILNLLLGTGAGSTAYCIIEQGRVDQILQANASTRRKVFEEAAGISRYEADKAEAERKLVRVDQNLLRLTDIVDEIGTRLAALRNQAGKAAKYRDVSERLRDAWLGLAADDYRRFSTQLAHLADDSGTRDARIAEASERQQTLEARLARMDEEVSEIDDRLHEAETRASANREAIAGRQVTVGHERERALDLDGEITRLRKQQLMMIDRSSEVVAEHARLRAQLIQFEDTHAKLAKVRAERAARIANVSEEIDHVRSRLAEERQRLLERTRAASALGSRVMTLEAESIAAKQAWEAAEIRRARLDDEMTAGAEALERCRVSCDQETAAATNAREALQAIRDRWAAVNGESDDAQRNLATLREQRSGCQARLTVLEDFESRKEGLGIGPREILSRAVTSDYPPWNHVRGSVADLFEVDLEQAALVEVALGARAQLIVLDDIRPLLEYVRSESSRISGRVGFVEYAAKQVGRWLVIGNRHDRETSDRAPFLPSRPTRSDSFTGRPGVIERADRLVKSPDDLPGLAEQLLSDTWIVDTLQTALALREDVRERSLDECDRQPGFGRTQTSEQETSVEATMPSEATDSTSPSSASTFASESVLHPSAYCPLRFVTLQGELLDRDGTLSAGTVRSETGLVSRKSELRKLKNDLGRLDRRIAEQERRLSEIEDSLGRVDEELVEAKSEVAETAERHASAKSELTDARKHACRLDEAHRSLVEDIANIEAGVKKAEAAWLQAQMDHVREEEDLRIFQDQIAQAERELARDEHRFRSLEDRHAAEQLDLAKQEERLEGIRQSCARVAQELLQRSQQRDEAERRLQAALEKRSRIRLRILATGAELAESFLVGERLASDARKLSEEKRAARSHRTAFLEEEATARDELRELQGRRHDAEMEERDIRHRIATLEQRIEEEFQTALSEVIQSGASAFRDYLQKTDAKSPVDGIDGEGRLLAEARFEPVREPRKSLLIPRLAGTPSELRSDVRFEDVRPELEAEVERLRRQFKAMGNVDTDSLHDLDDLENRYGALAAQLDDLRHAKAELEDIVRRINIECRRRFSETFDAIRGHFRELFRKLFGGGEGDIILEDPDDPLECGIDIVARPPGKELRSISLLSGGERTMTAVGLLMAIFKSNPSPFCVLDEVDAALDEANVDRFMNLLHEFRATTQFIMITHRKPSMTVCDTLYGVTMEESGVSKRMSVRFEDVDDNGNFRTHESRREAA